MRVTRAFVGVGVVLSVLVATPVTASASVTTQAAVAPAATTTGVTADYEMNEPPGSTVMTDSSGNGLDGVIDPTGLQTGQTFDGATGYNWIHRSPTAPPPSPERVIQVPDNINLEPGTQPFTLEIRYRTKEKFGNIIQKGQSASPGGQWKIQNPGGIPSCLFKGSRGQVGTNSLTPLNDNQWHTLTCVLTTTSLTMYVDGVFRSKKNGTAGTVDNKIPMTVGGKINCDQIEITCDYYSGQIDYVKITKGTSTNLPPHSLFSSSCTGRTCTFNGSASNDPDGTIGSYAWNFGDNSTGTGAIPPPHTYAADGTYSVTLTVLDNGGLADTHVATVTVAQLPNQLPTAAFTPTCDGLSCSFDSSTSHDPDGTIASYAWTFGDGATSTAVSPSHTFPITGSYDVTLTVTDNQGGTGSTTSTLAVAGNAPPVADFSSSCAFLDCLFDSSAAHDPDGTISSYAWTFADDGSTSTEANPSHTYAGGGTFDVTLAVTDDLGAVSSVTKSLTVSAQAVPSPVAFVASAVSAASNKNATVTVPATAAGQRLVMVLSVNSVTSTISDPTGVTGWTKLDSAVAGSMSTTAWTKVAAAGDVGAAVHVPISATAKYTITVAAYSGTDPGALPFARATDAIHGETARSTPDVVAPAGGWVVSYWADKSSATTAWTPSASVTSRSAACDADAGRVCSNLADSGASVPAGTYGDITATTNAPSDQATMWSFVLAPSP
jgi:PKD repeat protein